MSYVFSSNSEMYSSLSVPNNHAARFDITMPSTDIQTCKQKVNVHPRIGHEGPVGRVEVWLYSLFNLGGRWWWVVNATPWPLYPRERPGTRGTGGWMGPRADLDGRRKFRPTGIRSPDLPARSELLHRLRYSSPHTDV
jgi:hypothetical protein